MAAPMTSCKQTLKTRMCTKPKMNDLTKLFLLSFNLFHICCCSDINLAEIDNVLFDMKWPGPFDTEISLNDNTMVMKSAENEIYYCVLPSEVKGANEEHVITYDGPSEYDLIQPLFDQTTCSYRIETYWTYELCHGKHLRQYHEEKEQKKKLETQEYYLGRFDRIQGSKDYKEDEKTTEDGELKLPPTRVPSITIEGLEFPYFQLNFTSGTNCDLTGEPRKAKLRYVCHNEGRGEIYELKEVSTCEYEVIVLTSVLCRHPAYRQKSQPVNEIKCHSMEGAPRLPKSLEMLELERPKSSKQTQTKTVNIKVNIDGQIKEETVDVVNEDVQDVEELRASEPLDTARKAGSPRNTVTRKTTISSTTDAQLMKEFLTGEYCLTGGSGWWKYEFCFGQKAIQFHEDRQTKERTVILLGKWKEEAHLKWLEENPAKKPKLKGDRPTKSVSNMYVQGDFCDITGQPRFVEVKLKCKENPSQPHSVSIYLVEPNTCEYILVIESPILCSVIQEVDSNGVIDVPQVLEKLKKP